MKRIPFTSPDLKKLKKLGQRVLAIVPGLDLSNHNDVYQRVAKLSHYQDLHDLQQEAAKDKLPKLGRLTRADIQLAFAVGLSKLAGVSLMRAYRHAGKSKLQVLSVDTLTVECRYERELEAADAGEMSRHAAGWSQAERLRAAELVGPLKRAGAPGFHLVVKQNGEAFQWKPLADLYDAIKSSEDFPLAALAAQYQGESEEETLEAYLRESLIPESWVPIRELIAGGLPVPNHKVIALYSPEGDYIGRAIQHEVHGGVIPRLLYTDDEVYEALADVLMGKGVNRGASQSQMFGPIPGDSPIYTLKPGVPFNHTVLSFEEQLKASPDRLQLVPGVKGGSMNRVLPLPARLIWEINGDEAYDHDLRSPVHGYGFTYIITSPWLSEREFPLLFTHIQPEAPKSFMGRYERADLLPIEAKDFQARAKGLLTREVSAARDRLRQAWRSRELLDAVLVISDLKAMESKAETEFYARFDVIDPEMEWYERERLGRIAAARDPEHRQRLEELTARLIERFPLLKVFGKYSLYYSLIPMPGLLEGMDAWDLEGHEVMIWLAFLAVSTKASGMIEYSGDDAATLAVARWLDGEYLPAEVPVRADEFDQYLMALGHQSTRMRKVAEALAEEKDRRDHASQLRYAYVSKPIQGGATPEVLSLYRPVH